MIYAGFPAIGKTHFATSVPDAVDADSSTFSWIWRGPEARERHPDWPQNYIDHIRSLDTDDGPRYVLVSSHREVRDALVAAEMWFTLVYPRRELREEYRLRMRLRESPEGLITKVIDELWDGALDECAAQDGCDHIILGSGRYLGDALGRHAIAYAKDHGEDT